jgi:hypothetical protein
VSGQSSGTEVDLSAVNGARPEDAGVRHGDLLCAFVEAVMAEDEEELRRAREELKHALGPKAFVDACAVVGAFNVVDRIADATGIPLDHSMAAMSEEVRSDLDLARFGSSVNTFG